MGEHASWCQRRVDRQAFVDRAAVRDLSGRVRTARRHPSDSTSAHVQSALYPLYLFAADVDALMGAADALFRPLRASTMRTLVGLLAVTGMRIGETLRIEIGDIDFEHRTLLIRHAKGDRQRLVCLDATACVAVGRYLAFPPRRRFGTGPDRPLFTTVTGTAVGIGTVHSAFHSMTKYAGLSPRAGARPRLHDLRHSFATRTMIDAYETGRDPASTLAALTIWLGHSSPAYTYWYLQAVPELAAIAARRLEPGLGDIR